MISGRRSCWIVHDHSRSQESFHFIDGCAFILKRDLDETHGLRRESGCYGLGTRHHPVEATLLGIKDRCIFTLVVVAISIRIHIIIQSERNRKLTWIPIIEMP